MKILIESLKNCSCSLEKSFSSLLLILIAFYRAHISPLLLGRCIYYPSCSQYAVTALKEAPLHIAIYSILGRIFRCHPFSKGGWDPFVLNKNAGGHCCE